VASTSEPVERHPASASRLASAVAVVAGALLVGGLLAGWDALTAPLCFVWPWRERGLVRSLLHLAPGLLLAAAGVARVGKDTARRSLGPSLALFAAASLALQLGAMSLEPAGLATIGQRVESTVVTSYYTDAARVERPASLLAGFDHRRLEFHSSTHPPGPILYYWYFLLVVGAEHAAQAGGLAIGVLAALLAPAVAGFARRWGAEPRAAAYSAALWSLLPAIVKFLPEFDQIYPWFTVAIVLGWLVAIDPGRSAAARAAHAAAAGLALATGLFFAWNLVLIGVILAFVALANIARAADRRRAVVCVAAAVGVLAATVAASYLVLHVATGYRPIASLRRALVAQGDVHLERHCPWAKSIAVGPWDVLLGLGAPVAVLAFAALVAAWRRGAAASEAGALTRVGGASLVAILLSYRLPQELARVWIFLFPLLVVPAARLLARLAPRARWAILATQAAVLVVEVERLTFIGL